MNAAKSIVIAAAKLDESLENKTLEELERDRQKINDMIEAHTKAKKQDALNQIRDLARQYDLSFNEIVASIRTTTKRGKAPALYRNPARPKQTWSGKGNPPDWYKNHPNPESLRIKGA